MKIRLSVIAATALIATATTARAEQVPMAPQPGLTVADQFYYSFGGTYRRIELPRFAWVRSIADGLPVTGTLHVDAGGPAGAIGYRLDGLPMWLGMRPRIELAAQFLYGTGHTTNTNTGPNFYMNANGTLAVPNPTTHASVTAKLEDADGVLRFKTDFALGSMVTLTPGIGLLGGYTRTKYDAQNVYFGIGFDDRLNVKIQNLRVGGELGLDATIKLSPSFMLHAGVTGAMYMQNARLSSRLCVDQSGADGCLFPALNDFTSPFLIANDTETSLGYRLGASLGFTYSWGWAQLTLTGSAAFNGATPGLDYPSTVSGRAARLSYDDRWSYGGTVALSFPLN